MRKKGSKNKTKEPKTLNVANVAKIVDKVPAFVEKTEKKEVKKVPHGTICSCGHKKEDHHGGPTDWCNSLDCSCTYFR